MKIDVRIPYSDEKNLGKEYNHILETTDSDWVLLLDHDVFLALNKNWYNICISTIEKYQPALATCWTNKGGSALPWLVQPDSQVFDLKKHEAIAKDVYAKYGMAVTPIEKATGFFMLVNKHAWKKVGGFPGKGVVQEDWGYCKKLKEAGHTILRMDGLYVYHMKARSWAGKI